MIKSKIEKQLIANSSRKIQQTYHLSFIYQEVN